MDELGANQAWVEAVTASSQFLTILDASYTIRFINIVQEGLPDVTGTSVFGWVDPRFHQRLRSACEQARETGLPQYFESEAEGPNGQTSWYSNWVQVLPVQADGALVAVIGTDISHQRRIELALEQSQDTLQSLIDNAPDFILIVDREHRIEFINRVTMGFSREQVLGKRAEEFVAGEDRERVERAIEHVLRTGGHDSYEATVETPDGKRRCFSTRAGPIVFGGEVRKVTLISTDVTERTQLEAQLRQSQRLEALGRLAGGVAHDFNNLLTVILGTSDLALKSLSSAPEGKLLEEVVAASRRAASLVGQLLAFGHKQVLKASIVDLSARVANTARLLERVVGERIRVVVELASEPLPVLVDPNQLEQVVLNLAINARDAMPTGGELRLSTQSSGAQALLRVSDTGLGIDAAALPHVFEPFYTTKTVGEGTGLGLASVHGIVNQSGGQIEVQSTLGKGTTFTISLPLDLSTKPDEEEANEPEPERGSETILIVEDDEQVRRLLVLSLEDQGYTLLTASKGEEALEVARAANRIDVLITDVVMPGMHGGELGERMLAQLPQLKVLYMSGYPGGADLEGKAFLPKPFSAAALRQRLRELVDGK